MNREHWHEMRREALRNLAKKAEEAANMTDEQYAHAEGSIVWQEMQDCLDVAFAFSTVDQLQTVQQATTCGVLHDAIDKYLAACSK